MMRLFWLVMLAFGLVACSNTAAPPAPTAAVDIDAYIGSWRLITLNGQPVTGNATLNLDANGTAQGKGGCNTFSAHFTALHGDITFSQMISTAMGCANQALSDLENHYLQTLPLTHSFQSDGAHLTFFDELKHPVLEFTRQ